MAVTKAKAKEKTVPAAEVSTDSKAKKPNKSDVTKATKSLSTTDVAPADLIIDTAKEVETIDMKSALALVPELQDKTDYNNFKLGGLLSRIQEEEWYMQAGVANLKEYIETVLGLGYRKSAYLIQIYNDLVNSGVSWDQVKVLGWTKLRDVSPHLNKDNVEHWIKVAEPLTVMQLQEYLKAQKNSGDPDGSGSTQTSDVSTMTFKVHSDQREIIDAAIEKAKEVGNTEFATVALQNICEQYVAGSTGKKSATLEQLMQDAGWEQVLGKFGELYPDVDIEVTA
ncbi:MAG: hypothetical protein OEX12_11280 [Gammaproteobacteria bacterium]|nr:hypothetical protein [Gammaproteobacteria bacterium]